MLPEAKEIIRRYLRLVGNLPSLLGSYALAYADVGEIEEARRTLEEVQKLGGAVYTSPINVAMSYWILNEKDLALQWLRKALDEKDPNLAYIRVDPEFTTLMKDPRVVEMLHRAGLP